MASEVTFLRMPRSKPKTSAEGQEQLSNSLARMASAPVASKRVPITEIGFAQCRFVVEDRTFPALCCGEPTLGGSWCAHHRALVFVRVAAPNHRKPAQEPPKALSATAGPGPNASAKRPEGQAAQPTRESPLSDKQKAKPPHAAPPAQSRPAPAKGGKPRVAAPANKASAPTPAKDSGTQAVQRGAHDGKKGATTALKASAKVEAVPVKKGDRSAAPIKKPEPPRKSAAKPAPQKASSRKAGAAKAPAPAKKAAANKGNAAKRPRPATKTAGPRTSSAAKRPAAKKVAASRKSAAGKPGASRKKTTAGKRKTR
jgi:hypothetical protein